jgi:FdhD protein
MAEGVVKTDWYDYRRGWEMVQGEIIEEALMTIYVNGGELMTIMSTPGEWDYLALGFLKNEGFIDHMDEVDHVYVNDRGCCVDVWLHHAIDSHRRKILTSGCGRGLTFDDILDEIEPVDEDLRIEPDALVKRLNELHKPGSLHARARGVHSAGLSDGKVVLALTEDIGRHNTIDKLMGICMVQGIETQGRILMATGRISSEMLQKGARMGCPIIASRKSPTSMAIEMANVLNITLVGYVRRGSMRVYTGPERLGYPQAS